MPYKCPLCKTVLKKNRYLKVLGAWEDKAKAEGDIRRRLKDADVFSQANPNANAR